MCLLFLFFILLSPFMIICIALVIVLTGLSLHALSVHNHILRIVTTILYLYCKKECRDAMAKDEEAIRRWMPFAAQAYEKYKSGLTAFRNTSNGSNKKEAFDLFSEALQTCATGMSSCLLLLP